MMLDDMAHYWNETEYSREHFAKLQTCFDKWNDTQLSAAQDAMWSGFYQYYMSNGSDRDFMNLTDHWGVCYKGLADPRCQGHPDSEGVDGRHGWFGNGVDRKY